MEKKIAFYLKVNRDNSYVIPNLKHWIETAKIYEGASIYILCDSKKLKDTIIRTIDIEKDNLFFLESYRNLEDMNEILADVAEGKWFKIGQAHFTTYWHAKKNDITHFWNIDADDTYICLDPVRICELLKIVENYSLENDISMMGLDMWRSVSISEDWKEGRHWSFGITYTDNTVDWIGHIQKHTKDVVCKMEQVGKIEKNKRNVDWFFTYLREYTDIRIETFYFENLKFMHFFDYFINYPHKSSFYHWKDGKIIFPIMKYCYGSQYFSEVQIAEDVVKFDMGIVDEEALLSLINCSQEKNSFYWDIQKTRKSMGSLMKKRNDLYLKEKQEKEIIGWGAGNAFLRNYDAIKKIYNLKYVCDKDPEKWNTTIIDEVECISPKKLEEMSDVMVIVMVDNAAVCLEIVKNLLDMGITSFDHVQHWMEYVQGVTE